MYKYEIWDMVQILWTPTKFIVHELIKTNSKTYEYKLWEMWTDKYVYMHEYQIWPVGRPIGFDLSDS